MRVATVDIGTNTVLLLVAERAQGVGLRSVYERAEITRLGEGVDRTRRLAPAALERTRSCLASYARDLSDLNVGAVAVVATSAMRDAEGGAALSHFVRECFGVDAQVISGAREAQLAFRGGFRDLPVDPRSPAAVFDVGGGSTEVIVGRLSNGRLDASFVESFDVGSVRMTERSIRHDPPEEAELLALADELADVFAELPDLPTDVIPVGVAGTVTTLAAVAMGLRTYDARRIHGFRMSTEVLRGVVARLARCDLSARKQVEGLEPKRADVIVAGGLIVLSILDRWRAPLMLVSDGGVRWGLAEEMLDSLGA